MAQAQRQLAWLIDLNKCIGCQTCTVACKDLNTGDTGQEHQYWIKVNTMPGRGYPKDWEQMGGGYDSNGKLIMGKKPTMEDYGGNMEFNYEDVYSGGSGGDIHLAPKDKVTWGPNWEEDKGSGEYPNSYYFYFPRLCNHCAEPACAEACPYDAITKRASDGIVQIEESICAQCPDQPCQNGCPYKEIFFNPTVHSAQKCNACEPRIQEGIAPACVRSCPAHAMWVDYLDNEDGSVNKAVKKYQVALPLHPEFNTGANVYYVPPVQAPRLDADGNIDESEPRVPIEYLRSLFGEKVDQALETLKQEMAKRRKDPKESSELMDVLISRRFAEILGPFPNDPFDVYQKMKSS